MILLLLYLLLISFAQLSNAKQYRLDYTYHRKTDSFYKFHLENTYHSKANEVCEKEGGALFVPSSEEELYYVHAVTFKHNPDIGNYIWIGKDVGHSESSEIGPSLRLYQSSFGYFGLVTQSPRTRIVFGKIVPIIGVYKGTVMTRDGELESAVSTTVLPFICKVEARDVVYDPHCDIYIKGYEYYENVGSCYKIPRIVYSWNEAYDECWSHGAHLVVLNSELEHRVVHNLTRITEPVLYAQAPFFLFAGIRAEKKTDGLPVVFKTIFNETLAEAGYDQWSENEPNNAFNNEYCGTIFKKDGKYNDVTCTHNYAFICEKNVNK